MLKIFGRTSSINVRKVLWTCVELDLAHEREDWGTGFRSTSEPEFQALNPNRLVPVIQDGDFVLWQSNSIIRYLAASRDAEALYPAAARERARIDQWIDWQATELNNAWTYAFLGLSRKSPLHQDPGAIATSCTAWAAAMAILERQLESTGAYVAGNRFSLADIPVGLSVHRWFGTPMTRPEYPAVSAYYERLSQRAGFLTHGRNGVA
jgi:glutathione S-transferase